MHQSVEVWVLGTILLRILGVPFLLVHAPHTLQQESPSPPSKPSPKPNPR